MPEPIVYALLLVPVVYLGLIVHEAGHALAGRALGFVVTSVGLGIARPLLRLSVGRTRCYLGLNQPFQGLTFSFAPSPYPDWRRLAGLVAGGVIANALCAAAFTGLALCLPPGGLFRACVLFAGFNAYMAAFNLFPFRMRVGRGVIRSDGRLIIDLAHTGSTTPPPPDVIQTVLACRPLWQAVGETRMHRIYTLSAASSWISLGSTAQAEALFAEAASLAAPDPYIDWLEALTQAGLSLTMGELAEARVALARAEALSDPAGPKGCCLLATLRADLLRAEGKTGEAWAVLESLVTDPVIRERRELGLSVLVSRLGVACASDDQAAVASLRAEYEAARPRLSGDIGDLCVYTAIARFTYAHGLDASVEYDRALKALAALAALWRDAESKAVFLEAQRALIDEARGVLGEDRVAEFVVESPTSPTDAAATEWDRASRRWSLRLMLVNAAVFGPLVLLALRLGRPGGASYFFLAVLLGVFTLVAAVFLAITFVLGKLFPSLRISSGVFLLSLTVVPWVGGLFFAFFTKVLP